MILHIKCIEFIYIHTHTHIHTYIYIHTHTHTHVYITVTLLMPADNGTTAEGVMLQGVLNGQDTKLLKSVGWHDERGGETFQVSQESSAVCS